MLSLQLLTIIAFCIAWNTDDGLLEAKFCSGRRSLVLNILVMSELAIGLIAFCGTIATCCFRMHTGLVKALSTAFLACAILHALVCGDLLWNNYYCGQKTSPIDVVAIIMLFAVGCCYWFLVHDMAQAELCNVDPSIVIPQPLSVYDDDVEAPFGLHQ